MDKQEYKKSQGEAFETKTSKIKDKWIKGPKNITKGGVCIGPGGRVTRTN